MEQGDAAKSLGRNRVILVVRSKSSRCGCEQPWSAEASLHFIAWQDRHVF